MRRVRAPDTFDINSGLKHYCEVQREAVILGMTLPSVWQPCALLAPLDTFDIVFCI